MSPKRPALREPILSATLERDLLSAFPAVMLAQGSGIRTYVMRDPIAMTFPIGEPSPMTIMRGIGDIDLAAYKTPLLKAGRDLR